MSVLLQDSEIPVYKNRCFRLVVNTPVSLPFIQWEAEFHRETVKYINNTPIDQFVTPPINKTLQQLSTMIFTRDDGTTFTAGQVLNDIKTISDTVYING